MAATTLSRFCSAFKAEAETPQKSSFFTGWLWKMESADLDSEVPTSTVQGYLKLHPTNSLHDGNFHFKASPKCQKQKICEASKTIRKICLRGQDRHLNLQDLQVLQIVPRWDPEPPHPLLRRPAAKFKKRNSNGNSKRMWWQAMLQSTNIQGLLAMLDNLPLTNKQCRQCLLDLIGRVGN